MNGQGDGGRSGLETFSGTMNHKFRFSTSGIPTKLFRLAIGHCEVNRGQWPQVTLIGLETHLVQCQGSHPVMHWHQSHQLSPFKSIAPRQSSFTHDFAEIRRRLFLLWRHDFVTWPDLTIFSPRVARKMPHKLWNISARFTKRCGVQLRKTHGGCITPPPTGRGLKGVCLLHLLSENIFPVLRSTWFYVLMKQKWIWNLSLCYFSLFCFYLSGYDARTAERKSDSTWRTWYKQTLRVYHFCRPISWLIPEMQYPVIYIIKFSNN